MNLQFSDERVGLAVSNHIRFCHVHGRIILIDLCDGDYSILDEAATFLWDLAGLGLPTSEATMAFAKKFGIPQLQAQNDLMDFISECISRRLLTTQIEQIQQVHNNELVKKPLTLWNAWLCLRRVRKTLRKEGFAKTYNENMHMQFAENYIASDENETIENALRVFRYAENGFAVRTADIDCLPRSLALHRFLLSGGIAVDHCIGVRRFPFGAHAWVEASGKPIYDSADFVKLFTLITKISACAVS